MYLTCRAHVRNPASPMSRLAYWSSAQAVKRFLIRCGVKPMHCIVDLLETLSEVTHDGDYQRDGDS